MEVVTFLKSSRGLVPYAALDRAWRPGLGLVPTRSVHRPPGASRIVSVGLVFVSMVAPLTVCVHFFIYLSDCFLVGSTEVYDFGVCPRG